MSVWCDPAVSHSIFGDGKGMQIEENGLYGWILSTTSPQVMHKIRLSDGVEVDSWTVTESLSQWGVCQKEGSDIFYLSVEWNRIIKRYTYEGTYLGQLVLTNYWKSNKGVAWYNGYFYLLYVLTSNDIFVKKIDPITGDTEASYTLTTHTGVPGGITHAGDYWYTIGWGGRLLIKYDNNFNELEICDITDNVFNSAGLSYDGTYLWYVDNTNDKIHRTDSIAPVPEVKKKWCIGRVGVRFIRL